MKGPRREGGTASDGVDDGGVVGLEDTEERVEKRCGNLRRLYR